MAELLRPKSNLWRAPKRHLWAHRSILRTVDHNTGSQRIGFFVPGELAHAFYLRFMSNKCVVFWWPVPLLLYFSSPKDQKVCCLHHGMDVCFSMVASYLLWCLPCSHLHRRHYPIVLPRIFSESLANLADLRCCCFYHT